MEWQPIETAPKNPAGEFYGPFVLIYNTADGMPWPACWAQAQKTNDATTGAWWVFDTDDEIGQNYATHWMPLPEPPK